MGLAQQRASRERSIEAPLDSATMRELESLAYDLGNAATDELLDQGVEHDAIAIESFVHLRYAGTDTALAVPLSEPGFMRRDFEALHRQRFGFISPEKDIVRCRHRGRQRRRRRVASRPSDDIMPERADPRHGGAWSRQQHAVLFARELARGADRAARGADARCGARRAPRSSSSRIRPSSSSPAGSSTLTRGNDIVLTRTEPRQRERLGAAADPVLLEVFNNLFMAIAEQMGEALRNTAQSVNIKERLDFSCAVFDATGALVANAPHLPVHLGSMDRSVETIIRERGPEMRPGDAYMLNAPYNGGTHLPDITVVTPVFDERARCCSTWRAAAITRTSAASHPAR